MYNFASVILYAAHAGTRNTGLSGLSSCAGTAAVLVVRNSHPGVFLGKGVLKIFSKQENIHAEVRFH